MEIIVPDDLGGLKVLPESNYNATLNELFLGKAKESGQPKVTFKYVVTTEPEDGPGEFPTVGEEVLETLSLQPKAMWRLNDKVLLLTGDRIPGGTFTQDDFEQYLKNTFIGTEWRISTANEEGTNGERTVITDAVPL